ncbi:hypothetical protein SLEP1_g22051 [Rubroshorea leprosula]|uniref:Cytochrome P450 n=1 Tax=Rubroshorea leprosula TaxID=152421 RepID=A0AAV5JGT3_9ROSI|nr:hypothetical protein SLEP1_g22051 [Rubroshorea leprosula]
MWSFLEAFKSQNPETFIYNLVSRYGRTGIYTIHIFWSPGVIVFTAEIFKKVFDETMRMASLFLCIFREAKVYVNINGYLVPKGWKVLVWNRGLHMDPENYPSPQVFSPSSRDNQRPKAGSFIPFGAGTRICPGADLAKLQTFIFLHYFLLNYELERVNPRGPTEYFRTPSPADNCLAKVTRLP